MMYLQWFRLGAMGLALAAAVGCAPPKQQERPMIRSEQVVRTAVCQTLCIDSDLEGNFRRIENALEIAAREGAELATFPETALLGWVNPDAHQLAGPIPGPSSERIGQLARKYNMMIAIGLAEKEGDDLYDSAILVDRDGKVLLKHRKMNTLTELLDPPYKRGKPSEVTVAETSIGKVGMLICADTFVAELVEGVGKLEPDLMIVPYGWAADMDAWPEHARSLQGTVGGAAKMAGCAVIGTDLVGMITKGPWKGRTYGGASVVANRDGEILAVLRDRDTDVLLIEVPVGRGTASTKPAAGTQAASASGGSQGAG